MRAVNNALTLKPFQENWLLHARLHLGKTLPSLMSGRLLSVVMVPEGEISIIPLLSRFKSACV